MNTARGGFTLIELLLASLVLLVGLTGAVSVSYLGMTWSDEIKIASVVPAVADMCIDNAAMLSDNGDETMRGWVNGYYVVRRLLTGLPTDPAVSAETAGGMRMEHVLVQVFRSPADAGDAAKAIFSLSEYRVVKGTL